MNPNINMHSMQQQIAVSGPNAMMTSPVPVMMQNSPQQQSGVSNIMPSQAQNPVQQQQQQQQQQHQQAEKIDNISKIKSLLGPLRESLYLTIRSAAFSLQQNNQADNLKRDTIQHARFDKNLEEFYGYCDQIELHLKTAMQCMQQLSSAQHYLPGVVTPARIEPYMQDNPTGPMPYATYLNTVRVHVQSAKDIHDTLISAAQNISQAD